MLCRGIAGQMSRGRRRRRRRIYPKVPSLLLPLFWEHSEQEPEPELVSVRVECRRMTILRWPAPSPAQFLCVCVWSGANGEQVREGREVCQANGRKIRPLPSVGYGAANGCRVVPTNGRSAKTLSLIEDRSPLKITLHCVSCDRKLTLPLASKPLTCPSSAAQLSHEQLI